MRSELVTNNPRNRRRGRCRCERDGNATPCLSSRKQTNNGAWINQIKLNQIHGRSIIQYCTVVLYVFPRDKLNNGKGGPQQAVTNYLDKLKLYWHPIIFVISCHILLFCSIMVSSYYYVNVWGRGQTTSCYSSSTVLSIYGKYWVVYSTVQYSTVQHSSVSYMLRKSEILLLLA